MAHNKGKYPLVKTLPANALPVQAYAEEKKITVQWIYKQLRLLRDKKVKYLVFKMVLWKTHNYVVPLTALEIKMLKQLHPKNVA